jgi:hypothetical protein
MRTVTASRVGARRSTNGHGRRSRSVATAQNVAKGWAASVVMKFLLRKSVLIAIGLGTLASWWVKHQFFSAKPRRFRLFS